VGAGNFKKKKGVLGKGENTCSALPPREYDPTMDNPWRYERGPPDPTGKLLKSTDSQFCDKSHVSGKACRPKIPSGGNFTERGICQIDLEELVAIRRTQ
jgi:hypothetical protein